MAVIIAHLNKSILNLYQALSSYQGMISLHGVRSQKVKVAKVSHKSENTKQKWQSK